LCLEIANVFVKDESSQGLEALDGIVGPLRMSSHTPGVGAYDWIRRRLTVASLSSRFIRSTCPGVQGWFGQVMVDTVGVADPVKDMGWSPGSWG